MIHLCVLFCVTVLSSSHTSVGADVVILGGDLNMHPQDLGNRLLLSYTGLRDSYLEAAKFDVGSNEGCALEHNFSHHFFYFIVVLQRHPDPHVIFYRFQRTFPP